MLRRGATTYANIRLHGSGWVEDPSWERPLDTEARDQALKNLCGFIKASNRLLVITGEEDYALEWLKSQVLQQGIFLR